MGGWGGGKEGNAVVVTAFEGVAFRVVPVSTVYVHPTITQSEELTRGGGAGRGKVVMIATAPKLSPKADL